MIELPILNASEAQKAEKPRFWRSLNHRNNNAAALERDEFMEEATAAPSNESRRSFLQLMAASAAMAGLTACRPKEEILPYTRKPEEVIPGEPLYFATAMPLGGVLQPLLVQSHEGRPTKVEGNPDHPSNRGRSSTFAQASVLNLYDPDRSRTVMRKAQGAAGASAATWADFVDWVRQSLAGRAARVGVLAEASSSPTLARIRQQMQQAFPQMQWVTYDAAGAPSGARRPVYRFSQARVIVSLDGDFLDPQHPNYVQNTLEFANSRRLLSESDQMSRLYAVESAYSVTGGMADNRLRLRSGDIPGFAAALAARLGVAEAAPFGANYASHPWVDALAQDIMANSGRAVVVAGETQPAAVHALCERINQMIGGEVISYAGAGASQAPPQMEGVRRLVDAMNGRQMDVLLILGANPVYSLPAQLNFAAAMANVPETIHLGEWYDDTAKLATWHVPRAHYLEMWGDGFTWDGLYTMIQPLIAPLYNDAHSDLELVNLLATGEDTPGYDLVRETARGRVTGDFERGWRQLVHDGFLRTGGNGTTSQAPAIAPTAQDAGTAAGTGTAAGIAGLATHRAPLPDDIEVVIRTSPVMYDGRFSNNAWMLELPDPITKVVWENVAVMNPLTAEKLGLKQEHEQGRDYCSIIKISANGYEAELPIWIVPGFADNSISVYTGWNRDIQMQREVRSNFFFNVDTDMYRKAPVGNGKGTNVYPLLPVTGERVLQGADIQEVRDGYLVVSTQDHSVMEGRPIALYGTVDEYRNNPEFARDEYKPLEGLEPWDQYPPAWSEERSAWNQAGFDEARYADYQWGMAIDLQTCTGCNACVVACQSENNIPVVGKDEVKKGREMHWLRIDRYFVSPHPNVAIKGEENIPADPQMVTQPMMCVHCEYAPCEQVCPVNATSHSPDGINEMTYNRCIGTRYCSNNCPWKVRRYNWFNWTKNLPVTVQMANNPNVTVRFRGVMEKCTYCVQRVRYAQRKANIAGTGPESVEVQTACQQACPAEAITFGNLRDENSPVVQLQRNPRAYKTLAELNTKPRTSYLARVYNPNPALVPPQVVTSDDNPRAADH